MDPEHSAGDSDVGAMLEAMNELLDRELFAARGEDVEVHTEEGTMANDNEDDEDDEEEEDVEDAKGSEEKRGREPEMETQLGLLKEEFQRLSKGYEGVDSAGEGLKQPLPPALQGVNKEMKDVDKKMQGLLTEIEEISRRMRDHVANGDGVVSQDKGKEEDAMDPAKMLAMLTAQLRAVEERRGLNNNNNKEGEEAAGGIDVEDLLQTLKHVWTDDMEPAIGEEEGQRREEPQPEDEEDQSIFHAANLQRMLRNGVSAYQHEGEQPFCFICFDAIKGDAKLRPGHARDCHQNLCDNCLHDQLQFSILNADVENLECPSCYWPISLREIEVLCTKEELEKYHRFLFDRFLGKQPYCRRCGLPGRWFVVFVFSSPHFPLKKKKGCDNAVIADEECAFKDWKCDKCATQCPFCKEPAHTSGTECDAFKRFHSAERGYKRFAAFHLGSKRCPKCRILIIKNKGCPHMTCKSCGFQFCWKCKRQWQTHDVCLWTKVYNGIAIGTAPVWLPVVAAAVVAVGAVVVGNLPLILVAYAVYRKWRKWKRGY